jgi:hypothetical protein
MIFPRLMATLALLSVSFAPLALAQSAGVSGHWEGAIHVPNQELAIVVDLAKNDKGQWMGAIDIPPQHMKGFPLSSVTVKGNSVAFVMKGAPGDPTFDGKLSSDGQSISGNFTQGGASLTFVLKRTGDAKFEVAKSTSISKEREGALEGALEVNGARLRLVLNMKNRADGAAGGSIVSVDQKGTEIPITVITQKDSSLKIELKLVNASFIGDLKDGELVGEWTQGPGTLPLTFKRPAK